MSIDNLVPLTEKLLEVPQELIRTALADGTVIADTVGDNRMTSVKQTGSSSAVKASESDETLGPHLRKGLYPRERREP